MEVSFAIFSKSTAPNKVSNKEYERAIKYLNRLLENKPLKTARDIEEVKSTMEQLNSLMYKGSTK